MDPLSDGNRALRKVFVGNLYAQDGVLPRKKEGRNYVEVVHKVREWPVTEASHASATGSSAQRAAKGEKSEEAELEDNQVLATGGSSKVERWRRYWQCREKQISACGAGEHANWAQATSPEGRGKATVQSAAIERRPKGYVSSRTGSLNKENGSYGS